MEKREHYAKLLALLEKRTVTEFRKGMEVVIKKIPDSDAEGELDPRVYEDHKDRPVKASRPDFSKMDIRDIPIEKIRAKMGSPNLDVSRSEIRTLHRTIEGGNGGIPVRIYFSGENKGSRPAVVYFHGGGFMGGSVGVVENACKALADKAGAVVVSVDYRLAPEHPFPAGLSDCFDAVKWVYANAAEFGVHREQIAVAGDSAGGNMAAVCSLMDRDQGTGMIRFQALIYPVVDLSGFLKDDRRWKIEEYKVKNHRELIMGWLGDRSGAEFMKRIYLQDKTDPANPYVSPLCADRLEGLPETLIITAEYDVYRLEAEAYAKRLQEAGVRTKLIQYNGMIHAFVDKIGIYPQAEDCINEIAREIRRVFPRDRSGRIA